MQTKDDQAEDSKPKARKALLLSSLALIACAHVANAEPLARSFRFAIAPKSLSQALRNYSQISRQEIIFTEDLVAGKMAPALEGEYTAQEALDRLLEDTGLTAEHAPSGALMIRGPKHAMTPYAARDNQFASGTDDGPGIDRARGPLMLAQDSSAGDKRGGSADKNSTQNPESSSRGSSDPPRLEEVVITSEKKSDTLQRIPAAVTALQADQLVDLGITSLTQLSNVVPGVAISSVRTQAFIFIRGVGQTLTSPNADPAVVVDLNGADIPSEMTATSFYDVERIEVLPGPQGTLYGRNSTGGVVNIITRMPGSTQKVDGFVEIGNYGRVESLLGVDIPATDKLAFRAALTQIKHAGYFSNGEDDQRTFAGRLTGVWHPTDSTKITAIGSYGHNGGIGSTLQNFPAYGCGYRCATWDPKQLGYFQDGSTEEDSLTIEQLLGAHFVLTYIGGYNALDYSTRNSAWTGPPASPLTFREQINMQTHEARLNGTFGRLDTILGAYYFTERVFYNAIVNPVPAITVSNGPFVASSHGTAFFAQGTYSLTDRLRLTGGGRYSKTDKSLVGSNTSFLNGVQGAILPYQGQSTLDRTDWKGGVEFDLTPRSMLYGNIATGFTPGGFSAAPIAIGQLPAVPFKPVYLKAYTAGVKNRILDDRLTVNLESFYYDYKNYQVSQRNAATGQNNVYTADKATVYGAQLDAHALLTRADDLSVSASYLRAKADVLRTPTNTFDGLDLPFSPHWTANVGYEHRFNLSSGAQIRGAANFQYIGARWGLYTHAIGSDIGANTHTDLNLGYHQADDHWSIVAWVRNVEDKLVKTFGNAGTVPGPVSFFVEPPRTYGVTGNFKF